MVKKHIFEIGPIWGFLVRHFMAFLMCSPEEKYEAQLIKELGDELVPMSTPGMAVFTLRFEEHILDKCVKIICIAVLE